MLSGAVFFGLVGDVAPSLESTVWAALIAGLVLTGFATGLLGMVIIFPLLGHATWRAYRELVE